jgi:hypothetical protein
VRSPHPIATRAAQPHLRGRSRIHRLSVAVSTVVTALAVAACGSSRTSSSTGATVSDSYSQAVKLAVCMRAHGVTDFPDPTSGSFSFPTIPGITQQPAFRAAQVACERFVPTPVNSGNGFSPVQIAQMQRQALAQALCMRVHGAPSLPDPKLTSEPAAGLLITFSGSTCKLDTTSPAFRHAAEVCPSGLGGNLAITFIRAQQQDGAACA